MRAIANRTCRCIMLIIVATVITTILINWIKIKFLISRSRSSSAACLIGDSNTILWNRATVLSVLLSYTGFIIITVRIGLGKYFILINIRTRSLNWSLIRNNYFGIKLLRRNVSYRGSAIKYMLLQQQIISSRDIIMLVGFDTLVSIVCIKSIWF